MKIAIVGCGAMGSVYAGLFAAAGNEVWAIDRWREHVEAMRSAGLRLEGASGDRTVKVNATTEAKEAGPCDLVILATKAMHVEQRRLIGRNSRCSDRRPRSCRFRTAWEARTRRAPSSDASASWWAWWAASAPR